MFTSRRIIPLCHPGIPLHPVLPPLGHNPETNTGQHCRDALLAIFTTDCLNDLSGTITADICTIHAFDLVAINYLKPSTTLCMAHTSELQDFNRETICGQGDYLWQTCLVQGTTLGPEDRLWGLLVYNSVGVSDKHIHSSPQIMHMSISV